MFGRIICSVMGLGVLVAVGCGGDAPGAEGSGGEGGSGAGGVGGGGTSYTCCINDTKYVCGDKAAFDRCGGFDIDKCMSSCAPGDFDCQDGCFDQWGASEPDPSGCSNAGSCGGPSPGSGGGGPSGSGGGGPSGSGGGGGDDVGKQCQKNADCQYNACLFADGASFGYCSKTCMSFTECPTFWSCEQVGNATATYCVQ